MMMVVLVHTLINSYGCVQQEMIRFPLLCFTMPLFAFISGYFSKPEQQLKKNINLLLIPCLVFTLINDGIQYIVNPNYYFSLKTPGFAMWYLWALFVYRSILPYIYKIPHVILLSFVLTWCAGLYTGINSVLSLSRIICFLPYFLLGNKIAHEQKYIKMKESLLHKNVTRGGNSSFANLLFMGDIYLSISRIYDSDRFQ